MTRQGSYLLSEPPSPASIRFLTNTARAVSLWPGLFRRSEEGRAEPTSDPGVSGQGRRPAQLPPARPAAAATPWTTGVSFAGPQLRCEGATAQSTAIPPSAGHPGQARRHQGHQPHAEQDAETSLLWRFLQKSGRPWSQTSARTISSHEVQRQRSTLSDTPRLQPPAPKAAESPDRQGGSEDGQPET